MRRTVNTLLVALALVGVCASAAGAHSEPTGPAIGEPQYRHGPKATLYLTDRLEPGHTATRVLFVMKLKGGGGRSIKGISYTAHLEPGTWRITATPLTGSAHSCGSARVKLVAGRRTRVTLVCSASTK